MAVETRAASGLTFPRLHWSAIFAGVALAIASHIVLGLVGAALGLAAEPADSEGVGAAAAIWALITPFVATLLGAWLAARMANDEDKRSAHVHGILVWCVGLIAGALFLTGTMATGAMSAGTAASGNLGPAQRMMGDTGARPGQRLTDAEADEAAKRAAAGMGAAALAAISGLLGAVVGAGLATRERRGRGLGWRVAIQRREEGHAGRFPAQERYAGTTAPYGAQPSPPRMPGTPGSPDVGSPPGSDPYHH
jgi:hypothetical protein